MTLKYLVGKKYKSAGSMQITVKEQTSQAPVAALSCQVNNLLAACSGLASYDPQGQPLTYTFDYSDGHTETNFTGLSSHPYMAAGLYTIKLSISNLAGLTAISTTQVQAVLP